MNKHNQKHLTISDRLYIEQELLQGTSFKAIAKVLHKDPTTRLLGNLVQGANKLPRKHFDAAKTIIRKVFNHARIKMNIDCIPVKNIMADLYFPSSAFADSNKDDACVVFKLSEISKIKNSFNDTTLKIQRSEHRAQFSDHYEYYIGEPKKGKHREVILSEDALAILNKILSSHNSQWLFPSEENADNWTRSYHFDKTIRSICRQMDIPVRSLHKLRKTYSSILLFRGVPDKLVQKQLGHADISTTHKAYYYDIFDTNEKVELLQSFKIGQPLLTTTNPC
ncbi:MAG: hypothetical protein E7264_04480 [Lachnospiraceae bacterium]|nr:hypothetical protein [Lachnospiraceae bacterium]